MMEARIIGCVLWQLCILLTAGRVCAQPADSTLVFPAVNHPDDSPITHRRLELGLAVGAGGFTSFERQVPKTIVQPVVGFDFIAMPGRWPQFLFGGRLGMGDRFSSSYYFGIREPIGIHPFSVDGAFLVFDEEKRTDGTNVGGRLALVGEFDLFGGIRTDLKFAAEYRGSGTPPDISTPIRNLWWYGMDVGFVFSLTKETRHYTRTEIVKAEIYPIATVDELNELESFDDDPSAIEIWLDQFWKKRDPTPSTPRNEARIEYDRRVKTANDRYSRSRKPGTMTEQGRVFVIYGEPDYEDEDASSTKDQYKYILWVYNGRLRDVGRAVFVFESFGIFDWKLIYSNVPSEYRGPVPSNLPAKFRQWF